MAQAFLLVAGVVFSLQSCTISSENLEYRRGEEAAQNKDFKAAIEHFNLLIEHDPKTPTALKAAKEAARITHYETKNYKAAVGYYKDLVLYSPLQKERVEAQKQIANLQFAQILDYTQSITEYSRLLELPHSIAEDLEYRTAIAKSYFYQNNFFQAQAEIDSIIKRNYQKALVFDPLLLKANIYLATKQIDEAISVLRKLIVDYPERSKTESVALILALCFEEQKNYGKAIETLESIRNTYPRKDFIEKRIKVLRERQAYLPGAKGLKK